MFLKMICMMLDKIKIAEAFNKWHVAEGMVMP